MGIETYPAGFSQGSLPNIQKRLADIEFAGSRHSLILNGAFETWQSGDVLPTGWATAPGSSGSYSTSKDSTVVRTGGASWKTVMTGASVVVRHQSPEFRLPGAGELVEVKWWSRASVLTPRTSALLLTNTDANPPQFGATGVQQQISSQIAPNALNTWQLNTAVFVIQPGQTRASLSITQESVSASADTWIEDVSVIIPATPPVGDDTGWIAPTLSSPWIPYGGGWDVSLGYRRKNGIVYGRGLIKPSSGTPSLPSTLFVLPATFRPAGNLIFATYASDATSQMRIYPDGIVALSGGTTTSWVTLGDIRFPADL